MADKTEQTIYIDADPAEVMKAIADLESYPEWINEYKQVDVLDTDDAGYPKKARMLMDATIFKDTLIMNYDWPTDRQSVSWVLESSSLLRSLEGSYILTPKDAGTDVTYQLAVDLAIPMIGMLKRKAERRLIDGALKDLKKRVEG
ncbi:SRPBCC family protein [Mycobacterium sp.]|uniref:SRPBCC family protein n=1 Tax=Mycobacterium sp. TaxID=1785 RepID=UPI003A845602